MKIEFVELSLYGTFASYANKEQNHSDGLICLSNSFQQFLSSIETTDYLIKNRKKFTDEEFVQKIRERCKFMFDGDDMLKILSIMNNKKYINYNTLKTRMYHDTYVCNYCVDYEIAFTETADIDFSKYYSISEIKQLINSKEIVLLESSCSEVWSDRSVFERTENYHPFTTNLKINKYCLNSWFFNLSDYLNGSSNEFELAMFKYIRKKLTTSKLKQSLKNTLEYLNKEIKEITTESKVNDEANKLTRMCQQDFEEKGYTKRLSKLNADYKN